MIVDDFLKNRTGDGAQFWMDWIGNQIPKYTTENRLTQSDLWLRDLSEEIFKRVKQRYDLTVIDENILCSSIMSIILTLWSCRIIKAKAYDQRRQLEARQKMMSNLNDYHHALLDCMVNETMDHLFFPKQQWHPPFIPAEG